MSKFGRKLRVAPSGFEYIEPTLVALDNELKDKVNEPHEGLRKNESQWPVHQINWQKSRYVYDMYYTYNKISRQVYDYCIENKLVDAALIAKWKKPGYETLCSTYVINPRNYKFGTVSICRVPKKDLAPGQLVEDPMTGCRGCGAGGSDNIFSNKYGQYLAAIQVAREERKSRQAALEKEKEKEKEEALEIQSRENKSSGWVANDDDDNDDGDDDDDDDDIQERLRRLQESNSNSNSNGNSNSNSNSHSNSNSNSNNNSNSSSSNYESNRKDSSSSDNSSDDDVGPKLARKAGEDGDGPLAKRSRDA